MDPIRVRGWMLCGHGRGPSGRYHCSGMEDSGRPVAWPPDTPSPRQEGSMHVLSVRAAVACLRERTESGWTITIRPWMRERYHGSGMGPVRMLAKKLCGRANEGVVLRGAPWAENTKTTRKCSNSRLEETFVLENAVREEPV